MKRYLSLFFGVLLLSSFVSSCSLSRTATSANKSSAVSFSLPFTACGKIECGRIVVPIDYADNKSTTIELAVYRRKGTNSDARQHPLFVHPGGPGADVRQVVEQFTTLFPNDAESFDVIGLSTRASQDGTGAQCTNNLDDVARATYDEAAAQRVANGCTSLSPKLVGHSGTRVSVEDINQLRLLLGYKTIGFAGWSYGATLGAALVMQYPDIVSSAVLDAPADPTIAWSEEFIAQQKQQLRVLSQQVSANDYNKLLKLQQQLRGMSTNSVNDTTLAAALELRLYDKSANEFVTSIFTPDVSGTASIKPVADSRMGRDVNGSDDGGIETQIVVRCSDMSRDDAQATVSVQVKQSVNELQVGIGAAIERICSHLPQAKYLLRSLKVAKSAANTHVLVVATHDDPVMPSSFSVKMAKRMKWGSHIVNDSRHLAVGFANEATSRAVQCLLTAQCS